jgi:RNA recognition motif-containing protein
VSLAEATAYGEHVVATFLKVLYSLEEEDRKFILGFESAVSAAAAGGEHPHDSNKGNQQATTAATTAESSRKSKPLSLPSSTGIPFVLKPVTLSWDPLVVARSIEASVVGASAATSSPSADRLTAAQVQTLHACVHTVEQRASHSTMPEDTLSGPWLELFTSLKDYIFVCLCDPDCAMSAVGLLSSYLFGSSLRDSLLQDSRFVGSLRLLYPLSSDEEQHNRPCQFILESFLRDIFSAGKPFDTMAHQVVASFAKNYTNQYEKSMSLQKLLKELSSKLR